jgi:GDPmannose 4,6-dehydratase
MKKRALICGISGQDGSYLAKLLLSKGYKVFGTSRDAQVSNFSNLQKLGCKNKIIFLSMSPEDFRSVFITFQRVEPDEIYFLAGQSSVGLSFEQPAETIQSISLGTLNILEAAKILKKQTKIYFAGSSETFGDTNGQRANEKTSFNPKSPYAVAKASASLLVDNYREAYGLFVCTGILFNHESPLRPKHFVTKKIVSAAVRISKGSKEILELGRLDISRDWGWAPEYVEAMWLILQQKKAENFVIATGETNTLEKFVEISFSFFGLNWKDHVKVNESFKRPSDLLANFADVSKAYTKLGWKAKFKINDVIRLMISEQIKETHK